MDIVPDNYSHLAELIARQLRAFPAHRKYLETRFRGQNSDSLLFADKISGLIARIAGDDLDQICEDYQWLAGVVREEELNFRRTGRYRLSSAAEAEAQVYSNLHFMARYMNGLLMSQLWWENHTGVLRFFVEEFLATAPASFSHLEVGPGHGLFLFLAAASPHCARAEGWDISDTSLDKSRKALAAMGACANIALRKMNIFDAPEGAFSSITFSEVLEHLESPLEALRRLHALLGDGGRIFINAPVNSPAPDHLYLFETPEAVIELVEQAGFAVKDRLYAPQTGCSLERARKQKLTISVAMIAEKS